jgi:hypothetical protein
MAFFNATPQRAAYLSQLTSAVTVQIPYDGPTSTISMFDAGLYTDKDQANPLFPAQWTKTPVCAEFQNPTGTIAEAQVQSPATDVYINSKKLKSLTQSTILHESLHNLTGLGDDDLEVLLGLLATASKGSPTDVINKILEMNNCALNTTN